MDEHQERVFLRWWQAVLPPGSRIRDLCTDIQSSMPLVQLLEILSGKKIPGVTRLRHNSNLSVNSTHHNSNINSFAARSNFEACLNFVTDTLKIKLVNITVIGLAAGDRKQIFGLTCKRPWLPRAAPACSPSRSSRTTLPHDAPACPPARRSRPPPPCLPPL